MKCFPLCSFKRNILFCIFFLQLWLELEAERNNRLSRIKIVLVMFWSQIQKPKSYNNIYMEITHWGAKWHNQYRKRIYTKKPEEMELKKKLFRHCPFPFMCVCAFKSVSTPGLNLFLQFSWQGFTCLWRPKVNFIFSFPLISLFPFY